MGERRRCSTVPTHPQACLLPGRRPPAAIPRLVTRQHQPTPGRWPCLMAAGSHTRRDRRRGATCQVATVSSQEKTKLIRGPLRTSSVSVAAAVTQCLHPAYCACPAASWIRSAPGLICESPSRFPLADRRCRSMSERTRGGRSWKETGVSGWRPMPSGPWQIGRHRWPSRVTEARPDHGPPDTPRRTAVHPIPVGLTESHHQRKGRLAHRSAVHL